MWEACVSIKQREAFREEEAGEKTCSLERETDISTTCYSYLRIGPRTRYRDQKYEQVIDCN